MTGMNVLRIIEWLVTAALLALSLTGCGRAKEEPTASVPPIPDAEIQSLEEALMETAKPEAAPVLLYMGQASMRIVTGANMSLNGTITVNFYLTFADLEYQTTVTATINGREKNEAFNKTASSGTISVPVYAKEMNDDITITMSNRNGSVNFKIGASATEPSASASYTVAQIADMTKSADASCGTLMDAMLNYGAYSQLYFNYKSAGVTTSEVAAIEETSSWTATMSNFPTDYKVSAVLILEDQTTVRFYVTLPSADSEVPTAKYVVSGYTATEVSLQKESDTRYYYDAATIAAGKLDNTLKTFTVSVGEGTCRVQGYSPSIYAIRMQNKETSSDALKNLCHALYAYNAAAAAYSA